MGKYNLELQGAELEEITLNGHGDKIFISADDAGLWRRFTDGCKTIETILAEAKKKLKEAGEKYTENDGESPDLDKETYVFEVRVDYCERIIAIIDGIFGTDTIKKSFRDDYEKIPGFIPDESKFTAFIETITPIMEDIFKKKKERMDEASIARMEKYQPQDFKKKESK